MHKKGQQSLKETFKRAVSEELVKEVEGVDLELKGKEVRREINTWLSGRTNGKIGRFFRDELDPKSSMLLISASSFAGRPAPGFALAKEKKDFGNFVSYNLPLLPRPVEFLEARDQFRAKTNADLDADLLEVPFGAKNLSLVIVSMITLRHIS